MEENKIKENEIRIGNWFHHKKEWSYRQDDDIKEFDFQFESSDWFALGECTLFYENFEPILLTEEWLLKFGLKYNGYMYSNGSNLVISKDVSWFGLYMERHEDDVKFDCPKYIHQFQNLYFALTGEELKINK